MPGRPVDKVYTTYKRKCSELKIAPVEKKAFEEVFSKQKRIINYMLSVLQRKKPFIVSPINKDMMLYTAVENNQATINVWTPVECEALTGIRRAT